MVQKMYEKLKKRKANNKGFSLIEMIIVIAIMAILIAIIAPNLVTYLSSADSTKNAAAAKTAYSNANTSLVNYRVANGSIVKDGEYTVVVADASGTLKMTVTSPVGGTTGAFSDYSTFFNLDELGDGATFKITVASGAATSVVYTPAGSAITYTYPN